MCNTTTKNHFSLPFLRLILLWDVKWSACLCLSLVHSTSQNKVSCLYERLIWFLSIVYTSSFTIFSSNFSPLYVYIYFYLFVALCKIVQMYYYYYLSLFFHLDGIFAGTFKTSAEQSANTYFFLKVAVFSIIICGEMSQGLLGFYIKRIKIRVFLDFVVIVFRGMYL